MERFEIVGISKIYEPEPRFDGFYLKEAVGAVDPFVDGYFMPECLRILVDDDGNVLSGREDDFRKTELEWAQQQIGKKLECEGLHYRAFATIGKVNITP